MMRLLQCAFRQCMPWALLAAIIFSPGCRKQPNGNSGNGPGATGSRKIVALGRLEPAGGIIAISAVPGPGQRLQQLNPKVVEGAVITVPSDSAAATESSDSAAATTEDEADSENEAGKTDPRVLGHLASYDISQAQLEALYMKRKLAEKKHTGQTKLAEVQQSQAEATLEQTLAKKAELASNEARLANLEEAARLAQTDYQLLAGLQEEDPELVTRHQLERHQNKADRAQIEYEIAQSNYLPAMKAAEAACAAARKGLEVAKEKKSQLEEIAKYEIEAINKEIELAQKTLAESELRLPTAKGSEARYTVLKINLDPGEFVTQMPVMLVGDLSKMVCIAEVYEADTKDLREGQKVRLYSSAFDDKYARKNGKDEPGGIQGVVRRVGTFVTSPGLISRNPLAPSDRSVVEVLIDIDEGATAEAARHVQMQVMVEFSENDGE